MSVYICPSSYMIYMDSPKSSVLILYIYHSKIDFITLLLLIPSTQSCQLYNNCHCSHRVPRLIYISKIIRISTMINLVVLRHNLSKNVLHIQKQHFGTPQSEGIYKLAQPTEIFLLSTH